MASGAQPDPQRSVYVLGGNDSSLAWVTSLQPVAGLVYTQLTSLAWTPVGVVLGDHHQRVGIAADNVGGWVDRTFPASDERAFVSNGRDLELLLRVRWAGAGADSLSEDALVNPDDVPPEILDAIAAPPAALVTCAVCRRQCVRDDFVWNDRQLCAWDYHTSVFGRRGPWRLEPYDENLFESLPKAAYVSGMLLEELNVDAILATSGLDETTMRTLVNTAIEHASGACLAVRTAEGMTLLRERAP
jgi:hypothetical protein